MTSHSFKPSPKILHWKEPDFDRDYEIKNLSESERIQEIRKTLFDLETNLTDVLSQLKNVQQEALYAAYPYEGDEETERRKWSERVWERHEQIKNEFETVLDCASDLDALMSWFLIFNDVKEPEETNQQLPWFDSQD